MSLGIYDVIVVLICSGYVSVIVNFFALPSPLLKRDRDGHIQVVHGLHRGMAHLLTFAPPRGGFNLRLLAVVLAETNIHIPLNVGDVGQNIADHTHLNSPSEEIQLSYSGLVDGRLSTDLEAYALTAAEWIKEPLGIGLEFALVMEVDHKLAGGGTSLLDQRVTNIELLGIIGHEPVYESETHGARTGQNRHYLFEAPRLIVEVLEPTNDEILFALNTVFVCLSEEGVHCLVVSVAWV